MLTLWFFFNTETRGWRFFLEIKGDVTFWTDLHFYQIAYEQEKIYSWKTKVPSKVYMSLGGNLVLFF